MTERFIIGTIGAPFGVKGFIKVHSASGETGHLLKLKSVIISKDGKDQKLKIAESALALPAVLIRFEGIDTPEAVKLLNGAKLIGSRDQAAPLNKGEYYIEDLKELPVQSEDGRIIGHVIDIIEGGGGELAEIKLSVASTHTDNEKILVPFRKEFFAEIAPEKNRLILNSYGLDLVSGTNIL